MRSEQGKHVEVSVEFVYRCPIHGEFIIKKPAGEGTDTEECPVIGTELIIRGYEEPDTPMNFPCGILSQRVYTPVPFSMKAAEK